MTEWPIVPDSKSGVRATVPGVQIPLSPFKILRNKPIFSKFWIWAYLWDNTPVCNYLIIRVQKKPDHTRRATKLQP